MTGVFFTRRNVVIRQSEAAECGLACLAMVASASGMHVTLAELRRQFPTSLKGATLGQLVDIARRIGLAGRAVRLELDELVQLRVPCILHWDLGHFVVLEKVGTSGITILDPGTGRRRLPLAEVSAHFTGIALELWPTTDFARRAPAPPLSIRRLTGPVAGLWPALGQVLVLSLALQAFVILAPFFMQWVVDQALVSHDRDLLAVLGIGFSLALCLQVGIGFVRGWSVVHLSSSLGIQWVGNVFAHLLRLPIEFFERRHLGDITSRAASVQAIQKTLTTSFIESIIDGLMALVTLGLMVVYSGSLAAVTLLAVVAYLSLRAVAFRPAKDRAEQHLIAAARQQTHLLESLRGIQSIKVAGREPLRQASYQSLMVETVNGEVALAQMGLGFAAASQLIFGTERIAVIWLGALLAMDNVFSVGMLIAYLAYKDQFAQRASALVDKWIEYRMLRLHGERLSDIVLTVPDDIGQARGLAACVTSRIEVEGLSFRYADGEPWVLRDCSFVIEPGQCVVIAGASGSGKSTLLKVVLGLLRPTHGAVRVGGVDVHRPGGGVARNDIGTVMQDDQLFAGTISDNISFFDPDSNPARVEGAAKLAAVHEDVIAMPMGYHSLVGDMGAALSGGQKQRVVLARALYRDPRILVLDEATSHLDVRSERQVNEAITRLRVTRLIAAHRPETIASADRVLVMEGGRIVREWRPGDASGP